MNKILFCLGIWIYNIWIKIKLLRSINKNIRLNLQILLTYIKQKYKYKWEKKTYEEWSY